MDTRLTFQHARSPSVPAVLRESYCMVLHRRWLLQWGPVSCMCRACQLYAMASGDALLSHHLGKSVFILQAPIHVLPPPWSFPGSSQPLWGSPLNPLLSISLRWQLPIFGAFLTISVQSLLFSSPLVLSHLVLCFALLSSSSDVVHCELKPWRLLKWKVFRTKSPSPPCFSPSKQHINHKRLLINTDYNSARIGSLRMWIANKIPEHWVAEFCIVFKHQVQPISILKVGLVSHNQYCLKRSRREKKIVNSIWNSVVSYNTFWLSVCVCNVYLSVCVFI